MYVKYALCLIKDPDIVGLALFISIRNCCDFAVAQINYPSFKHKHTR